MSDTRKPRLNRLAHPRVSSTVDVYRVFRADPSPANAVALARANFQKEHGQADSQFIDALQLAEMLLRDKDANAFAPST